MYTTQYTCVHTYTTSCVSFFLSIPRMVIPDPLMWEEHETDKIQNHLLLQEDFRLGIFNSCRPETSRESRVPR